MHCTVRVIQLLVDTATISARVQARCHGGSIRPADRSPMGQSISRPFSRRPSRLALPDCCPNTQTETWVAVLRLVLTESRVPARHKHRGDWASPDLHESAFPFKGPCCQRAAAMSNGGTGEGPQAAGHVRRHADRLVRRIRQAVDVAEFESGCAGPRPPHQGPSLWMAGGGINGGHSCGATDELGYNAVQNVLHVHDPHATIPHRSGIDRTKLTDRFQGRDSRLADVEGGIVGEVLSWGRRTGTSDRPSRRAPGQSCLRERSGPDSNARGRSCGPGPAAIPPLTTDQRMLRLQFRPARLPGWDRRHCTNAGLTRWRRQAPRRTSSSGV